MKVTVFGSGTWGTALAQVLTDNGHKVLIYGIEESQVDDINNNHMNSYFFGENVHLNENIKATTDIKKAINFSNIYVLSVPTAAMRSLLNEINAHLDHRALFINTAKGFDTQEVMRISDVIRNTIDEKNLRAVVSLIGPSHAEEVVVRMVTAVTATSKDKRAAEKVQKLFSNQYFRVYTQTDEIGAELGVAYKNAIAIASGILAGLGYGDNARAALITRGLAEMVRFSTHFGGKMQTYLGLTGLGDLIVTCNSIHSRNFQAGLAIGRENNAENFIKNNKKTVEGIRTTKIIYEVAKANNIDVPIINAIYKVLYENVSPREAIVILMDRPLKPEH
ncbi:MAG: NAD(P)H-dependent glycerol-3-phosphate dehydrogenase [Bacilli bacterium]|jgi:glycerol-3-phosphate dehydrogenase (NAD(P)+)